MKAKQRLAQDLVIFWAVVTNEQFRDSRKKVTEQSSLISNNSDSQLDMIESQFRQYVFAVAGDRRESGYDEKNKILIGQINLLSKKYSNIGLSEKICQRIVTEIQRDHSELLGLINIIQESDDPFTADDFFDWLEQAVITYCNTKALPEFVIQQPPLNRGTKSGFFQSNQYNSNVDFGSILGPRTIRDSESFKRKKPAEIDYRFDDDEGDQCCGNCCIL